MTIQQKCQYNVAKQLKRWMLAKMEFGGLDPSYSIETRPSRLISKD